MPVGPTGAYLGPETSRPVQAPDREAGRIRPEQPLPGFKQTQAPSLAHALPPSLQDRMIHNNKQEKVRRLTGSSPHEAIFLHRTILSERQQQPDQD